jgi:hypothetical protein
MVEQVVGRGELDAPSAWPVRYCSQPVVMVFEVDTIDQRRDVASTKPHKIVAMAKQSIYRIFCGHMGQMVLCHIHIRS